MYIYIYIFIYIYIYTYIYICVCVYIYERTAFIYIALGFPPARPEEPHFLFAARPAPLRYRPSAWEGHRGRGAR